MTFLSGVLQENIADRCLVQGRNRSRRDTVGILIIGAGAFLSIFLGIVLFSVWAMAQKTDQVYDLRPGDEEMVTPADAYLLPAPETLSSTSRNEERPQGDLAERGQRAAQ